MSIKPYTDEQWYAMCDNGIGKPMPLHEADLVNIDWVYYRPWGLMYVPSGYHVSARATLYAFHHGYDRYLTLAYERDNGKLTNAATKFADAFLMEIPGTAFKSSMSERVTAGKRDYLDGRERAVFRKHCLDIRYLEDRDY